MSITLTREQAIEHFKAYVAKGNTEYKHLRQDQSGEWHIFQNEPIRDPSGKAYWVDPLDELAIPLSGPLVRHWQETGWDIDQPLDEHVEYKRTVLDNLTREFNGKSFLILKDALNTRSIHISEVDKVKRAKVAVFFVKELDSSYSGYLQTTDGGEVWTFHKATYEQDIKAQDD